MQNLNNENPALLIIDMVKDNFDESKKLPITPFAQKTIPPLNHLISLFRDQKWPVVFSTDAFQLFFYTVLPVKFAGRNDVFHALDTAFQIGISSLQTLGR